ncbi:CYTH domain-containing protein [Microbacterium azadirachtae]|uniref:CYTH domain-containing protein n=1 Tax=Microbacterium azadirachtae TaxID=582680 RepID=A0A1I6FP30_9MICO|nr:CYTH domain-containing protein [Microbacterium azadirachtae]SFR31702.1 CYTH domain-containing protein [Microbacterium azadirachtae]
MSEPSRTVEIERKYDVDGSTPLPSWDAIPGVDAVSEGELRELDARYFDTAEGDLARAGVALRRRSGGPDEGWHVKGPRTGDGRVELGWPLGASDEMPAPLTEVVAQWTTAPLLPLARIENTRTAYRLLGPDGVVAEFVDDRVRGTDLRGLSGPAGTTREWREWEMELGPAAPSDPQGRNAFFRAVEQAVAATGGRPSPSGSKLARALGY